MNDTELAVATIDWIELIARAIYDYDCNHVEGHGDTLEPDEVIVTGRVAVPFESAHPFVRKLYHGRAMAAMSVEVPK